MASIVIRLDPANLEDPDLDLRYEIPDLLTKRSKNLIQDQGYDYESNTNALLIFLGTPTVDQAMPHVLQLLEQDQLHGNQLSKATQVGVSDLDAAHAKEFRIVYPIGVTGFIRSNS